MSEDTLGPPPKEGSLFRAAVGFLAMVTAIVGFGALFFIEIPPGNRDALMFALGGVFGWASSVVSSEYGASTTGRKAADAAVKQIERKS